MNEVICPKDIIYVAETLQTESTYYVERIEDYSCADSEAKKLFAKKTKQIMSTEHIKWRNIEEGKTNAVIHFLCYGLFS